MEKKANHAGQPPERSGQQWRSRFGVTNDGVGGMMLTKSRAALAVVALYLALYIVPLGWRPLFIPDETRYAEIPREILASGDWVVPRLNGLRYFEKPVLGYWANALSIAALGQNPFAVRLPGAIAAGVTAVIVFLLVRACFRAPEQELLLTAIAPGDRAGPDKAGLLAAAAYLTCGLVFAVGAYSVLDNLFTCLVTAAIAAFFFAMQASQVGSRLALLGLAGVAAGMAFMTKGLLGIVVPVLALGPCLVWERRWRDLLLLGWIPLLVAVLVAAPWAWLIQLREPEFWRQFFWVEHVQRFMKSGGSQHPEAFWFFVPITFLGLLPWSPVALAALPAPRQRFSASPLVRLAGCWFFFPFLFFSASHGKLATYILPCVPPVMVLGAVAVAGCLAGEHRKRIQAGMRVSAGLTIVAAVVLLAIQIIGTHHQPLFGRQEIWRLGLVLVGLVTWSGLALAAARQTDLRRSLAMFAAAPLLALLLSHVAVPGVLVDNRAPGAFVGRLVHRMAPEDVLITDKTLCSSVCWYSRRADALIVGRTGELDYGLSRPDASSRRLTSERLQELVAATGPERTVVLVLTTAHYSDQEAGLPTPDFLAREGDYVWAEFGRARFQPRPGSES